MDNIEENSTIKENRFFTPSQMFVGTLLGGILTVDYMIAKNYSTLNYVKSRNFIILFGIVYFIIHTLYFLHYHPKSSFIGTLAAIGILMSSITKRLLTEKGYIKTSKNFLKCDFVEGTKLYSWGHVIFASVIGLILTTSSFMIVPILFFANFADIHP